MSTQSTSRYNNRILQVTVGENSNSYDAVLNPLPEDAFSLGNVNDEMLALFALGNLKNKTKANLEQFLMTFPNKKKRREILLQCCILKSLLDNNKPVKKKTKKRKKVSNFSKLVFSSDNQASFNLKEYFNNINIRELLNQFKEILLPIVKGAIIIVVIVFLGFSFTKIKEKFPIFSNKENKNLTLTTNATTIDELNLLSTSLKNRVNNKVVKKEKPLISFLPPSPQINKAQSNKKANYSTYFITIAALLFTGIFSSVIAILVTKKTSKIKQANQLDSILENELKTAQLNANKVDDNNFALNYLDEQISSLKEKKKSKNQKAKKDPNYSNLLWEEKLLFNDNDEDDDEEQNPNNDIQTQENVTNNNTKVDNIVTNNEDNINEEVIVKIDNNNESSLLKSVTCNLENITNNSLIEDSSNNESSVENNNSIKDNPKNNDNDVNDNDNNEENEDDSYSEDDLDLIAEQYLNDSFNLSCTLKEDENDNNNISNNENDNTVPTNDNGEEDENMLFNLEETPKLPKIAKSSKSSKPAKSPKVKKTK